MPRELPKLIVRTALGLLIVFLLVIGGGISAALLGLETDAAILAVIAPVAVILMVGAMVVSVAWMRSIDEAAREAHKAAWFWGGTGGMALGGVFIILASAPVAADWPVPVLPTPDGEPTPALYAASGAMGLLLLMTVGYAVAWAWWWWRRR